MREERESRKRRFVAPVVDSAAILVDNRLADAPDARSPSGPGFGGASA